MRAGLREDLKYTATVLWLGVYMSEEKKKHSPFTSDYSKVHASDDHPYEHVDQYSWGSDGKTKVEEQHGISVEDKPGLRRLAGK